MWPEPSSSNTDPGHNYETLGCSYWEVFGAEVALSRQDQFLKKKELNPFQDVQAMSRMLRTANLDMSIQTWIFMDKTLILGLTLSILH